MPTRALTLVAGTITTIAICAAPAAATSAPQQSTVTNNQVELANVQADQSLNVVDVSGAVTQSTIATSNTFTGSVVGSTLAVDSTQSVQAHVNATSRIDADGYAGSLTTHSAAATANDGESNVVSGTLSASSVQSLDAVNVIATADYNGPDAQTSTLNNNAQAVGNSQGYGLTDSGAGLLVNQSSAAIVQADSGVTLGYTEGQALVTATATSNNVTAVGAGSSAQALDLTQSVTGQRTQASVNANIGNVQDAVASANTMANNISITNEGGLLDVVTNQTNAGYVQSQSVLTAYEFGSAQSNAYGVGNSVMAGNAGSPLTMNNTQTNSGDGVVAQASFSSGAGGYDSAVSSIAMGNAVTGYACSQCGGQITIANRQTNSAEVGATSTAAITASSRSVSTTAAATGNSATFYVSTPTGR